MRLGALILLLLLLLRLLLLCGDAGCIGRRPRRHASGGAIAPAPLKDGTTTQFGGTRKQQIRE